MRAFHRILAAVVAILLASFCGVAVADDDEDEEGSGSKPAVVVLDGTGLSATTALLRGEVDPGGRSTTYVFEYGTTSTYGATTAPAPAGSADSWRPVAVGVARLEPGTTYHYRLVATNSHGKATSEDRTFSTPVAGEPPPPAPAPPVAEDDDPPAEGTVRPELAETVAAEPSGEVRVRRPGQPGFLPLTAGAELPVGSVVDARDGGVALTAALPSGETQTGRFGGGRFLVRQGRGGRVDLHLRGSYCPRRRGAQPAADGAAVARAARKRRSGRRLWGRDKGGRFRTHGENSHATVRGTRWVVADRCDGTLTRVTEGSVVVRDTVRRKRVIVRVGERYLARARR